MTLNEYQEQAMTTCTASSDNDTYALFGLMAEVGELADKVAKGRRKQMVSIVDNVIQPRFGGDPRKGLTDYDFSQGVKKELGDVLWFCRPTCPPLRLVARRGSADESRQTRRPRQTRCNNR